MLIVQNNTFGGIVVKKKFLPKTLISKILYTLIILVLYLIGRELPLFGVDSSAFQTNDVAENLLLQTIGGDQYRISLFSLGISPYMFSSMIVSILVACKSSDSKNRTSPKRITKATLGLMLIWASVQSYFQTMSLPYVATGRELLLAKLVSALQMTAGAFLILWLATRNGKYGIGGQTILIFTNMLDSIVSVFEKIKIKDALPIILVGVIAMLITLIFENSEFRIPMQRISIHSIYSDKNYIAIKLNPIGMMPVMFTSAFFMIPMYLCMAIMATNPTNETVIAFCSGMTTDSLVGVITYIIILYALTITFSLVMIGPKSMAEGLSKGGDSITGLRAGRKTKQYLTKVVLALSFVSATFMAIAIGFPLVMQLRGSVAKELISLPTIMMALVGVLCNLYREYIAVRDYDAYMPFL